MPDLPEALAPLAVLISDSHFYPTPPVARSVEEDWLAVQAGYIRQVTAYLPAFPSDVPLIHAGDVFDRPDPPASFLSWCWDFVPEMWAVPGQHDLPNHRLADMNKSAFGFLVKAGRIKLLGESTWFPSQNLVVHGFPWTVPIKPLERKVGDKRFHLAVAHTYCWVKGAGYKDAPSEQLLEKFQLGGYDAILFGDNHIPWQHGKVLNHGTLMRRREDEKELEPLIGLITADGSMITRELDTREDRWLDTAIIEVAGMDPARTREFVQGLEGLAVDAGLDLRTAAERYCDSHRLPAKQKKRILELVP